MTKTAPSPARAVPLGPLLFARGFDAVRGRHALSVLLAVPEGTSAPVLWLEEDDPKPSQVDYLGGLVFWRYDFSLGMSGGVYRLGSSAHTVRLGAPPEDLRIAFVSCNGKEKGDFERPAAERDALWNRLREAHDTAPLSLLIMGGDQIYADAALTAHPDLERWAQAPMARRGEIPASDDAEEAATAVFLDRWIRSVTSPPVARLMAEVPTLAMWDDHDIFDGYGSHPAPVQDSPLGQMLFRVARRFFRLFHAGGHDPERPETLSQVLAQPGFHVIAPDLRSERLATRVMGPAGWAETERGFASAPPGSPVFVVSTVPALGPRLSLLEGLHRLIPAAQRYEDDLRDQWQSRVHRAEWRRFLQLAADHADGTGPVTFLSGEIHLAGRGEMRTPAGAILHQLIASGISHPPPPPFFARGLGALGALGEAPLAGYPIALRPLPGGSRRYVAERNWLLLERKSGQWHAHWELEESGRTAPLALPACAQRDITQGRGDATEPSLAP